MSKEIVVAFLTGILGPVVLVLLKTYLDKRKSKPDMIKETFKYSRTFINKIMKIFYNNKNDFIPLQVDNF